MKYIYLSLLANWHLRRRPQNCPKAITGISPTVNSAQGAQRLLRLTGEVLSRTSWAKSPASRHRRANPDLPLPDMSAGARRWLRHLANFADYLGR